jgi:hypothetical protein
MPNLKLEQVGDDIKATSEDGRSWRIKGADIETARKWAEQRGMTVDAPVAKQSAPPGMPSEPMGPLDAFAQGMKDPYIGLHQRVTQAIGSPEDVAQEQAAVDAQEREFRARTSDYDWKKKLVRGAGEALNPLNVAASAAAPSAIPGRVAGALGKVGTEVAGGALGGAIGGGLEPEPNVAPGDEESSFLGNVVGGGLTGGVLGAGTGVLKGAVTPKVSGSELRGVAAAQYDALKNSNLTIDGNAFRSNAQTVIGQLEANAFHEMDEPKTFRAMKEVLDGTGDIGMTDIMVLDRRLSKIQRTATEPSEREAASQARDILTTYLNQIPKSQVKGGNPGDIDTLRKAAGNWRSMLRGEQVERAVRRGEDRAAVSGSGANVENAIRQKILGIIDNEKESRKFSDAEVDAMRELARGGTLRNFLRKIGKLAPTGVHSSLWTALATAAGAEHGGAPEAAIAGLGFAGAAHGAKYLGEKSTKAAAGDIAQGIYRKAPHYQANPPPLPAWWKSLIAGTPKALAPGAGGLLDLPDEPIGPGQ